MSTRGEVLYHPINRSQEQTWDGFSWPAFFFGVIWLLVKGLWAHFVINLLLVIITAGFAAPIIWIVYGFIGNGAHKSSLIKKGYLTSTQLNAQQAISTEPRMAAKDPIERLREIAEMRDKGILTESEFAAQKARLLGS